MNDFRQQEALRLLYFLAAATVPGALAGHPGAGTAVGVLLYLFSHLRQIERLQRWLKENPDAEPPEATGVWGEIFDRIHVLRRDERHAQATLRGIIERARASVSALQEAVVLIDRHGNLEWGNPAAEALLGLRLSTDLGQPVTNLIRDPAFVRYFEHGPYEEALPLPSPRHPGRQLQFKLTRFGGNDRLMIVTDITRLHNLEQMRKDFVANVSHELRTPLTVLTGYLETLRAHQGGLEARWQQALRQMDAQAQRMTNLVNDLLLLSRLENDARRPEPRVVDVPALLAALATEAEALGREKQQRLLLDCDPALRLLGREDDLRSAFSNLVSNAVKYTPPQGEIRLRWWADAQHVYFRVSDTGIGIEAHHIPRLTERFYRADAARSSATGGTGLGLAIVKHVLLEHDARLDIQSTPGKGATFTCLFPAALAVR